MIRQAIQVSEETGVTGWVSVAYAGLARVELACGAVDTAAQAAGRAEQIAEQQRNSALLAYYIRNIQVQSWVARGDIDRATRWAEGLLRERHLAPLLVQEQEDVVLVRILLAQKRSSEALLCLAPCVEQATRQQRWGHVIEMRLLEALAFQMDSREHLALGSLAQAVQLAEPEGYIRSFVQEGAVMTTLLTRMRDQQRRQEPTPYLDTVLAAFPQEYPSRASSRHTPGQPTLLDPLTKCDREVLALLARGASNTEPIAPHRAVVVDGDV